MSVTLAWRRTFPQTPNHLWNRLLKDVWQQGRGFPARPEVTDLGDENGIGCTRRFSTVPGTHLVERIEDGQPPHAFTYRVVNPGWRTFPVRWHRGNVTLAPNDLGGTDLDWIVTFEPLPLARWFTVGFTHIVIGGYLRYLDGSHSKHWRRPS